MKSNRLVLAAAIVLLSALCAGCAEVIRSWPPALDFSPSPGERRSSNRRAPSMPEPSETEFNSAPPPAPPAPPAPRALGTAPPRSAGGRAAESEESPPKTEEAWHTATEPAKVTLAGDHAAHNRAEQMLNGAAGKLARLDRAKLSGQSATAYDQASGFVTAARRAIQDQDYPAASGLAEKAAALADKLEAPASP